MFSENQINTDVQADGPYFDEENKSVPNTALSPEAIEEITLFVSPNIYASASNKLCFLRYHPISPSGDFHNLPFKTCRLYYRIMSNQTMVQRKWLSYSLHLNKIYCVTCLTSPFTQGITSSTKHVYNQVESHEKSSTHGMALMSFLLQSKNQCTKSLLTKKHSEDVLQRRLVLRRIIDIIKFIGTQGLEFRGKHEAAFSLDNNNTNHGNFLALVLLLAKYDRVLHRHVNTSIEASKKRKETHQNGKGTRSLYTFFCSSLFLTSL
ncbi:zinc finger MYM-type protein 1-like, partial [Aphis craccivora]